MHCGVCPTPASGSASSPIACTCNWGHEKAVGDTAAWLDANRIPYRDLCFLGAKPEADANAYIDDAPHNVEQLRAPREHDDRVRPALQPIARRSAGVVMGRGRSDRQRPRRGARRPIRAAVAGYRCGRRPARPAATVHRLSRTSARFADRPPALETSRRAPHVRPARPSADRRSAPSATRAPARSSVRRSVSCTAVRGSLRRSRRQSA